MAREVEIKLALPPSAKRAFARHPVLATAVDKRPARQVFSIYFDTPDQELRRLGIALRLRRIGSQWFRTVKCAGEAAGGLSSRPEWECPHGGQALDFSDVDSRDVRRHLEKLARRGLLAPLFETDFRRRTWYFEPEPGSRLVLAFDEGVVRAGDKTVPLCELEIEVEQGPTAPLLRLALDLGASLPLNPDARSKADRGYRLAAGTALVPVKAAPSVLLETDTPRQAFRKIALACLAQIQGNEQGLLASVDPEFVHQMRVGLRRLRSALKTFAPALPAGFTERFGPRLREMAGKLGAARDRDVLLQDVVLPVLAAFPDDRRLANLEAILRADVETARAAARLAVASAVFGRLMLELLVALHDGSFEAEAVGSEGEGGLRSFAAESIRRARKHLRKRAALAVALEPAALHQTRIAAKRLRYSLEFLAPLLSGARVKKDLALLSGLQTELGHLNDLANARHLILFHAVADPPLCEALALTEGWHRGRMAEGLASLPARLAALARGRS